MKTYLKLILYLFIFFPYKLQAQVKTKEYLVSSSNIANPERGWYDDYYNFGSYLTGSYASLDSSVLKKNREEDKITLILRLFYLHQFLNENSVSSEYIAKMKADFNAIRNAGVKCIVRFAYSDSQNAEILDATPEKVLSHIESLRDVLHSNADVIAAVQAGFIGAWGEWYYTENFAGAGYIPDETDQENRRAVVEALLNTLPGNIQVQVRTPAIKHNVVESNLPISNDKAYNGTSLSRVAHHNDCFLANNSDYGTYTNLEEDIAYLEQDTKYAIAGGETCDASNSYSDCDAGIPRMELLHWTYLNREYNQDVYQKWEDQGCLDPVTNRLGYRIVLKTSKIDENADSGDSINVEFRFNNSGFAAPTQYKPILIMLQKHNHMPVELNYLGEMNDIRYWFPGNIELNGKIIIPDTLSAGNYQVGICFPDQSTGLTANPAYRIQLANLGLWDDKYGINWLNQFISIGNADTLLFPETPTDLKINAATELQIELSWNDNANNETAYEIYRSTNDSNSWALLQTLEANSNYYTDINISPGNTYYYLVRAITPEVKSEWSNIVSKTLVTGFNSFNVNELTFFPNPLTSSTLHFTFTCESEVTVTIYNGMGISVLCREYNRMPEQINNISLQKGIYLVTVKTKSNFITEKLLIE